MNKLKHLADSYIALALAVVLAIMLPFSAAASDNHENEDSAMSNTEDSFSLSGNSLSESETQEPEYVDYFTTYGKAKASDTMLEEMYITLDMTLTYALRDDSRKSYSFSKAWSLSKEPGNYFESIFKQTDSDGNTVNYYNQVYQFYRKHKNADGYAQVTEEIVPALQAIAKKLPSLQSEDLWPALCYYKRTETAGKENPYANDPLLGEIRLVYGNEQLADEDAFVLLIMGDGFTASEREKFYESAAELAAYMMQTPPLTEVTDAVKIYAMSADSNESGISRDCDLYEDADNCAKDTYFGTGFWCGGMERLVSVSKLGLMKLNSIMRYAVPYADFAGLLVNSERYGGSGGTYCTCSLNESSKEIFIHEIAHTIANLADEYYAGNEYFGAHPNMSYQKKTENLPWADFYGLDGVLKYAYVDDLTEEIITYGGFNWYKPCDKSCKMEILWSIQEDGTSIPVPFCPVCSEALRKSICAYSNVTEIFYQPCNVVFKDDGLAYRLSDPNTGFACSILDYVLLRRGDEEVPLSQLSSLVTCEIRNAQGEPVADPAEAGTYTVHAVFSGNDRFDGREITFSYEIVSFRKEKGFIGCVEEILATDDYAEKYVLINKALGMLDSVNQEDASVMAAMQTLDEIIAEFNADVEGMNADAEASCSVTLNLLSTFVKALAAVAGFATMK